MRARRFLESKGFTFTMTDEEFVKEHTRLNLPLMDRFKLYWKEQLAWYRGLSRKQRGTVVMMTTFFAFGIVLFVMGAVFIGQFAPFMKQAKDYSDATLLKTTLDLVWVLALLGLSGIFCFMGLFIWHYSSLFYSYYLEYRIAVLEKKIAALEKKTQVKGEGSLA